MGPTCRCCGTRRGVHHMLVRFEAARRGTQYRLVICKPCADALAVTLEEASDWAVAYLPHLGAPLAYSYVGASAKQARTAPLRSSPSS